MRRPPLSRAFVLLATLALLPLAPRDARADWAEAKKQFLASLKDPDWHVRRTQYLSLVDYDAGDTVDAILEALSVEPEPVVVSAGLDTLGKFRSDGARKAAIEASRKGKPQVRTFAVVALGAHHGPDADAALAEAAAGPNAQAAAQAVLALGHAGRGGASAALLAALSHKDWQVRAAAARGLAALADKSALKALADRLATDAGTARWEVLLALESISKQRLGDAPGKWKALAAGGDPATVQETAVPPPTAFGVPITGQRVVFVLDRSLLMDDQHPYDRKRLEALCSPADGAKIPWYRIATKLQFAVAHVKHAVEGLPAATKFEVVHFCKDVKGLFEMKLTPATAGTKKLFGPAIDALKANDGIDVYDALNAALDIGGAPEANAWKAGPDEILFVTNNSANTGPIKLGDADAIAPAIGWKARLRMVPIHVVGIGNHPYTMAEALAARTGGIYVSLVD